MQAISYVGMDGSGGIICASLLSRIRPLPRLSNVRLVFKMQIVASMIMTTIMTPIVEVLTALLNIAEALQIV